MDFAKVLDLISEDISMTLELLSGIELHQKTQMSVHCMLVPDSTLFLLDGQRYTHKCVFHTIAGRLITKNVNAFTLSARTEFTSLLKARNHFKVTSSVEELLSAFTRELSRVRLPLQQCHLSAKATLI